MTEHSASNFSQNPLYCTKSQLHSSSFTSGINEKTWIKLFLFFCFFYKYTNKCQMDSTSMCKDAVLRDKRGLKQEFAFKKGKKKSSWLFFLARWKRTKGAPCSVFLFPSNIHLQNQYLKKERHWCHLVVSFPKPWEESHTAQKLPHTMNVASSRFSV